jgi:putative ABC transport system ATP-binding protein
MPDALTLADGRRLPLLGPDLSVGRAPTNDIVIDDQLIAAHHARLQRFPEGWVLRDLGGGAETTINEQPLTRPVFLAPNDAIRLGRVIVEFVPADAAPKPRPLAQPRAVPRATWGGPLVQFRDVVKSYAGAAGPIMVLRGVNLAVHAGEFVAISGPSGSGKSTLLNVMTGIDRPDAGEIVVAGQDLLRLDDDALVQWRGRAVGIVFQFFQLLPTLTVAENVMLPMAFCDTYRGLQRRGRALEVLAQVGMERFADRLPSALSGGEQQRVAIARALANDPPILVADEPTGNLDSESGARVFELFAQLVAAGRTVVMVTHDPWLASHVPRRVEMHDGRIVEPA